MLSGESVVEAGDSGVAGTRGVLPVSNPTLRHAVESMEAAWASVTAADTSAFDDADRRALLVRMETLSRAMYGTSHTWLTELIGNDGLAVLPERTNASRLACLLLIDSTVAAKRIRIAERIAPRRAMTGELLDPDYPTAAAAHTAGAIDAKHVTVIDDFFEHLPSFVDRESRVKSEFLLAELARKVSPEQLRVAAARLHAALDEDGDLGKDKNPTSKCFFRIGQQGVDGLSKGNFVIDAEFRAYLEPILAKLAKPGTVNPDEPKPLTDDDLTDDDLTDDDLTDDDLTDDDPTPPPANSADEHTAGDVDGPGDDGRAGNGPGDDQHDDNGGAGGGGAGNGGAGGRGVGGSGAGDPTLFGPGGGDSAPDPSAADRSAEQKARAGRDLRTQGQRNHDAIKAVLRQMLASGNLGRHRGLPVTAVITMSARELREASGQAVTGTGSLVSIRDAIRMASHAHQYLAVFDDHGRAIYLGRSKRIASADQRIVLMARDRGCTFPGCTRPATWSQTHHITEWARGGNTDVDSLTFGCDMHHALVGQGPNQWATTTSGPTHPHPGRTQWHPPSAVDPRRRGLINHYHHPGEYLYREPEDPEP